MFFILSIQKQICDQTNFETTRRQVAVATNSLLDVHFAFTMSAQVNAARRNVNVHQIVNYSALYVVGHVVHLELAANVNYFDV